jgi:inner membrane protein
MDNLTHSLAGAVLGEAGMKRLSGLGMAALVIGANLPDLDVLTIPTGRSLALRRGWTHGPIAMVVLPLLLTLALVAWDRWQARRGTRPATRAPVRVAGLLAASAAGVLSHPAMDWLNNYGVRLLMPFSDTWFHGDTIFIIDPWIWLALGVGTWLARRGARRAGAPRTRPARLAIALVLAYVAIMRAGTLVAREAAARGIADAGEPARRLMAGPVPLDPTRRTVIYDLGDRYRFGEVVMRPVPVVTLDTTVIPVGADLPAVRAFADAQSLRDFAYWSRFPYYFVERAGDTTVVHAADARFGVRGGLGVTVRRVQPSGARR